MSPRYPWRLVLLPMMRSLEYRTTFFVYMIGAVAGPVISLLVWLTVSDQGVQLPYDREQFVTYYLLLSLVSLLTSTWVAEYDLADAIRLGRLSPLLLRPVAPILHYVADHIGQKAVMLPLQLPLLAVVAISLRLDLALPTNSFVWVLFVMSVSMAATVAFLLDFLVGLTAFWIQDVSGIIQAKALVGAFLAGQVVPLAFFPPAFSVFLQLQPFRYTLSFPLEILMGNLSSMAIFQGFACQAGYCVLLCGAYRMLWRRGLRTYSAAGA
jgi:ABC-2 type transport system permease protein